VLADTLRTDRARLRPLVPDSPETATLRRTCRARRDLVAHRVALANQLRAHLRTVFPGAVGLFADIDSAISLAFLTRFPTQNKADWLTPTRLGKWLGSVGYSGKGDPAVLHARLIAAPRGALGADAAANAAITHSFVAVLSSLLEQIKTLSTEIETQLAAHADAHIFTSLPRAGRVRAARLRLRRRLPPRQPLGPRPLPASP
jgi:transposase